MTERELGDYTWAKDPSVMFIAEIWTDEARLKVVKCRLNFNHMFSVLRVNRGGGLVLFWKDSMNLRVDTSSKNHIDCIIGGGIEGAWRFTGFYREPITHKCHESWKLLKQLHS